MLLITKAIDRALRVNHDANHDADGMTLEVGVDCKPPLKLFTPWGACTWLISERDAENPDILFGLCDLGFGCPELGSVSLAEILALNGPFGLKIERDIHFTPKMTISEYADAARAAGRIAA